MFQEFNLVGIAGPHRRSGGNSNTCKTAIKNNIMKKYCRKTVSDNLRKYNNIVEALYLSTTLRKISGTSLFILRVTPDNRIVRKFTILGFLGFLLWYGLYFYCTYKAHQEDQTILRIFYNTKLQRFGDDFERISSSLYVVFAMWKIPYSLSSSGFFLQTIVNVDKALEGIGEIVDYNRDAYKALLIAIIHLIIHFLRVLSICTTLNHLGVLIPKERMYQVMYSDALAFITTAHFCFFLIVVRRRFKYINRVLEEIKCHKSCEYKLFVRVQAPVTVPKAVGLQDRYICEKIQACARIYGMLYKVIDAINKMFGITVMITMFKCQTYIILYLFYFMEATAAGLFHDVDRYVVFAVYVFWQIFYAMVIILLIVYCCETALYEAMQLSIQCLHQKPIFTAAGLYELNYALLHQLARSVSTYLIILLQFVTDNN